MLEAQEDPELAAYQALLDRQRAGSALLDLKPTHPFDASQAAAALARGPGVVPAAAPPAVAQAPSVEAAPSFPAPTIAITDPATKRSRSTTSTTATTKLDPKQVAVMAEQDALLEEQKKTVTREAEVKKHAAQIEETHATEELARLQEQNARRDEALAQRDQRLATAQAAQDQAFQKYQGLEMRGYWDNKATWAKVVGGIAIAAGAYAQALTGGRNTALDIINSAIEQDFAQQRATIEQAKDAFVMAKTGVTDAQEGRERWLADNKLKEAAAYDMAAQKLKQKKAALGVPLAEIEADATVQTLTGKSLAARAQALEPLARRISTSTTRSIVEGDKAAFGAQSGVIFGEGGVPVARVPGAPGPQTDKKATDVNKANANYRNLRTLIDALEESYKSGVANPLSDEYQRREAIAENLKLVAKEQYNLGALSGPDMGLIEGIAGGKIAKVTGRGGPKLQQFRTSLDAAQQKFLDGYGVDGARVLPAIRGDRPAAPAAKPDDKPTGKYDPATGTYGGKAAAPQGEVRRLKDGRVVRKKPDGSFELVQ